jgi:hypothetical protein
MQPVNYKQCVETVFFMPQHDHSSLPETIRSAFGWRARPKVLTNSDQLSLRELSDLNSVCKFEWDAISTAMWEANFDTVSWFSPEAFCYYLPGICLTSFKENRPNLIAVTSIIAMLDRSPTPAWWDDFFLERWPLLTVAECGAVQDWIWWLSSCSTKPFSEDSLMRALHTLELLQAMGGRVVPTPSSSV